MSVQWGVAETHEDQSAEQASQEQVSEIKPVTPIEPVAPRYPSNHITQETLSGVSVANQVTDEGRGQQIAAAQVNTQNVHSSNLWRILQEEAKQGEAN